MEFGEWHHYFAHFLPGGWLLLLRGVVHSSLLYCPYGLWMALHKKKFSCWRPRYPDDEAFLLSLRRSLKTARGAYPPVALAEIYQEYKSPLTKIRRLHLMVVDLFFFNRWLHRISRILAVLGYEGIKQATPVVLHPKRKSSAHSL